MADYDKSKITVFHCINAFREDAAYISPDYELNILKMPCSGMTTDVFMLKAFESGADAVIVLVCPKGACRYMEGSLRAEKRVDWTKGVLDEIGVGGQRLSIHNVKSGDSDDVSRIISESISVVSELGKNPAA